MKTTLTHTIHTAVLTSAITALLLGSAPATAGDWQEKMLLNPSDSQLKLEQRGRVMIYDGLTDKQIASAMDAQFDRIESMMFVRTIVTDEQGEAERDTETGEVIVEDDGC